MYRGDVTIIFKFGNAKSTIPTDDCHRRNFRFKLQYHFYFYLFCCLLSQKSLRPKNYATYCVLCASWTENKIFLANVEPSKFKSGVTKHPSCLIPRRLIGEIPDQWNFISKYIPYYAMYTPHKVSVSVSILELFN